MGNLGIKIRVSCALAVFLGMSYGTFVNSSECPSAESIFDQYKTTTDSSTEMMISGKRWYINLKEFLPGQSKTYTVNALQLSKKNKICTYFGEGTSTYSANKIFNFDKKYVVLEISEKPFPKSIRKSTLEKLANLKGANRVARVAGGAAGFVAGGYKAAKDKHLKNKQYATTSSAKENMQAVIGKGIKGAKEGRQKGMEKGSKFVAKNKKQENTDTMGSSQ